MAGSQLLEKVAAWTDATFLPTICRDRIERELRPSILEAAKVAEEEERTAVAIMVCVLFGSVGI